MRLVPYIVPRLPGSLTADLPECVVDTGALLAIIPEYVWRHFRSGVVTPLRFDAAMPHAQRFLSVAGGTFPYDLGELDVPLFDHHRGGMTVRVVAQHTRDGGALTIPMVLGLRGGFRDGRVLRAEPDPNAPFGQLWTLEDP